MKPWSVAIAVVAALAIVFLVGSGSDGRTFAQRALAGANVRPGQTLKSAVVVTGPRQAIVLVLDEKILPADAAAALGDASDLIATAANQSPEQAKATLDQAVVHIDAAMKSIEQAADDTSDLATKMRLEQIHSVLSTVKSQVQSRADQL